MQELIPCRTTRRKFIPEDGAGAQPGHRAVGRDAHAVSDCVVGKRVPGMSVRDWERTAGTRSPAAGFQCPSCLCRSWTWVAMTAAWIRRSTPSLASRREMWFFTVFSAR